MTSEKEKSRLKVSRLSSANEVLSIVIAGLIQLKGSAELLVEEFDVLHSLKNPRYVQ